MPHTWRSLATPGITEHESRRQYIDHYTTKQKQSTLEPKLLALHSRDVVNDN